MVDVSGNDRTSGIRLGCALLALAATPRADAQLQPERPEVQLSLRINARDDCVTAQGFMKLVTQHASQTRLVEGGGPDVLEAHVEIATVDGNRRLATLVLRWPDGRRARRSLTAGSCSSAREALALLLAMTLDESARDADDLDPTTSAGTPLGQAAGDTERPAAGRPTPAPSDATTEAVDVEAATGAQSATEHPAQRRGSPGKPAGDRKGSTANEAAGRPVPATASAPGGLFSAPQWTAGAFGLLQLGPAPETMPGMGVQARLSFRGTGPWMPALGIQLAHVWAHSIGTDGGDASFDLTRVQLLLCPVGVRLWRLAAHVCAAAGAGSLRAEGTNTYHPQLRHEPWIDAGGALLWSASVTPWLELTGGFELSTPWERYRFAFRPDVFHRVPVATLGGHLGAGIRFP